MMRQLFFNLLSNALKFSDSTPEISVFATTETLTPDGSSIPVPYHCLHVQDNGIGIDQKYAGKVFDMFQRLHAREAYEGNGIGLALCRTVVENHGGFIDFESAPGNGTTFRVHLPL